MDRASHIQAVVQVAQTELVSRSAERLAAVVGVAGFAERMTVEADILQPKAGLEADIQLVGFVAGQRTAVVGVAEGTLAGRIGEGEWDTAVDTAAVT
jgi:hypothetical protein